MYWQFKARAQGSFCKDVPDPPDRVDLLEGVVGGAVLEHEAVQAEAGVAGVGKPYIYV